MAGLPKKYAKMGFKRGWKAYKRSKGKSRGTSRRKKAKKGGYKMAKRGGSNSFLGIGNDDLWKGVGGGVAGVAGGVVNSVFPALSGNMAQGAAGIILSKYTSGKAKQIGKGIVIKTIGDFVEDNAMPMLMGKLGMRKGGGF